MTPGLTPSLPLTAIVLPSAAVSLVIAVALLYLGGRANILRASAWWAFGFIINAIILAGPVGLSMADPIQAVLSLGAATSLLLLLGSLRFLHHSALIGMLIGGIVVVVVGLSQGLPSHTTQRALNAALFLAGSLALFANGAIYLLHRRRRSLPFAMTIATFLTWGAVRAVEGVQTPAEAALPWAVAFEPMMATIAGISLMLVSRQSRHRPEASEPE
ncbi:MAG: hypothetical protein FJX35_09565 [Alphaproteobacteria bacterium]|nr:hypothetical protein [Alphaproteobacteria bacterium]